MTVEFAISDAEQQLLELVRGEDHSDFVLTISCRSGQWEVAMQLHNVTARVGPRAGIVYQKNGRGEGASFSEAWDNLEPSWASEPRSDVTVLKPKDR